MRTLARSFGSLAIAALLSTSVGAAAPAQPGTSVLEFVGRAHDPESGKFLYLEINRFEFKDGRAVRGQVSYEDPAGALFAERRLDFSRSLFVPEFHTIMHSTGFEEGLRRTDSGELEMLLRKRSGKRLRTKRLSEPEVAAADDGLVPFVLHHMPRLRRGEKVVFQFISPTYGGTLKFTAYKVEDKILNGRRTQMIRIDIGGLFIGLFTDPIYIGVDSVTESFVQYRGLSNLRNADGDIWPVVIDYPLNGLSSGVDSRAGEPDETTTTH